MTNFYLAAPCIPVAEADGLIANHHLQNDILVQLETWAYAHERDTYQLMLNGKLIGSPQQLPSPVPELGSTLTLTLAKEELTDDGVYQVSYQATNVLGGVSADSSSVAIRIDRSAPGGALLAAMVFPNPTIGDYLTALVPGYAGMEQGDVIQTLCNGVPGPTHTVQADELTVRPVEIRFERAFLESLAAETAYMEYQVTDRAGNQSLMSLPVTVSIKL
jgi:hypothetical protein